RMISLDVAPIFVVFISDGIVQYWRKTTDLKCWVNDITKLPPPVFSVAREYIDADYEFIYQGNERAQRIEKSVWFKLNNFEEDVVFFEYCIPTKIYKTIISIVWEA